MEANDSLRQHANRDKQAVALTSVLAAVFLTTIKLIVGVLTGSLGILAEALHSGLDLAAALVTLFAVRVAGQPADQRHTYGHGKVENLSALFETLLLLGTCAWIIWEAVQRLWFKEVAVEANVWAFAIVIVAIVVDYNRSRLLYRAARKYESQALEADALHFSTDIWSSLVVLGGLALVWLSERLAVSWLAKGDAVAAMGVAGIVIYVSLRLGRRTIAALLDEVPPGLQEAIATAVRVPGVVAVDRVRVRRSGPEAFADVTLQVGRDAGLEHAHDIASQAEAAVQAILPGANVVVHVEPVRTQDENVVDTVRILAARQGLGVHNVSLHDVLGSRSLEMHLEVADNLRLEEAHEQATALEEAVRQALPGVGRIVSHIEPVGQVSTSQRVSPASRRAVEEALAAIPAELGVEFHPHDLQLHRDANGLNVSFHCILAGQVAITDAHALSEQIEQALRRRVGHLGRVVIHVEPGEVAGPGRDKDAHPASETR